MENFEPNIIEIEPPWDETQVEFADLASTEQQAAETDPLEDITEVWSDAHAANEAFDAKVQAERELKSYERWGRPNRLGTSQEERDSEHKAGIAERTSEVAAHAARFRFYAGFPEIESVPTPEAESQEEAPSNEPQGDDLIIDKATGTFHFGS